MVITVKFFMQYKDNITINIGSILFLKVNLRLIWVLSVSILTVLSLFAKRKKLKTLYYYQVINNIFYPISY